MKTCVAQPVAAASVKYHQSAVEIANASLQLALATQPCEASRSVSANARVATKSDKLLAKGLVTAVSMTM